MRACVFVCVYECAYGMHLLLLFHWYVCFTFKEALLSECDRLVYYISGNDNYPLT